MFYVYIAIFVVVTALVHLSIYECIMAMFGVVSLPITHVLQIAGVFFCLSYFVAALLSAKWNNRFVRGLYKVASIWLGFLIYIGLACIVYALLLLVSDFVVKIPYVDPVGAGIVMLGMCITVYGFIHASRLKVKNIEVSIQTLPISWRGRTAVLISDVHLGHVRGAAFMERIVVKINSLAPDVVFIVGDLYDGVKVDEKTIVEPLRGLKVPQGTFFVTGNHEEFYDSSHFTDAVAATGVRVLKNELVDVMGLQIVGVNDKDSLEDIHFGDMLAKMGIESHRASVLLKHQPTLARVVEQFGISVQFSGHTHNAQFWPFRFIPRLIYKGFDYGFKNSGSTQIYTGAGVGTWGPPMRVGTDAEITRITFR